MKLLLPILFVMAMAATANAQQPGGTTYSIGEFTVHTSSVLAPTGSATDLEDAKWLCAVRAMTAISDHMDEIDEGLPFGEIVDGYELNESSCTLIPLFDQFGVQQGWTLKTVYSIRVAVLW